MDEREMLRSAGRLLPLAATSDTRGASPAAAPPAAAPTRKPQQSRGCRFGGGATTPAAVPRPAGLPDPYGEHTFDQEPAAPQPYAQPASGPIRGGDAKSTVDGWWDGAGGPDLPGRRGSVTKPSMIFSAVQRRSLYLAGDVDSDDGAEPVVTEADGALEA